MLGQHIAFDATHHDALQVHFAHWADPDLLIAKRGRDLGLDSLVSNRHSHAASRVAEVQARYLSGETDKADPGIDEDEEATDHA